MGVARRLSGISLRPLVCLYGMLTTSNGTLSQTRLRPGLGAEDQGGVRTDPPAAPVSGPKDHDIKIRILPTLVSGIPLVLGLRAGIQDPCFYLVFAVPTPAQLSTERITSAQSLRGWEPSVSETRRRLLGPPELPILWHIIPHICTYNRIPGYLYRYYMMSLYMCVDIYIYLYIALVSYTSNIPNRLKS